uniref:ATP synthase Fo subunit 8 n=2 Tax=Vesicomyidae TaxID=6588 RepID=A0A1B4WR43_9BIVA|nr:ATP synthase Fo subunit 8 [Isorropodon fossajaponicum]
MPQFSPLFVDFIFLFYWAVFISVFCMLYWISKRDYNFK